MNKYVSPIAEELKLNLVNVIMASSEVPETTENDPPPVMPDEELNGGLGT